MRSFCLAIRAFSASSSLKAGSRNAKNVSHGSSLHKPQCSSCFVLTQQLYNGQDSTFIIAVQNGFPFCCPHPPHFSPKCSQVPQNSPHTAAKFLFTILSPISLIHIGCSTQKSTVEEYGLYVNKNCFLFGSLCGYADGPQCFHSSADIASVLFHVT